MIWKRRILTIVFLAGAGGALAQTPAALPRLDVASTPESQALASATLDGRGNVTLLWTQLFGFEESTRWRRFGPFGPIAPDALLTPRRAVAQKVVSNRRGDVIAIWNERVPSGENRGGLRRISRTNPTLDLRFNQRLIDVDISAAGFFVLLWEDLQPGNRVMAQLFAFDTGRPLGPPFNVSTTVPVGGESPNAVAMNSRGEFVVVWTVRNEDLSLEIFGRRFNFAGPQGDQFQINTTALGDNIVLLGVDAGRADDGSFVVAWSRRLSDEPSMDIFAQRFNGAGEKLGGEILIAEDVPVTRALVRLAVAPQGHFVVAWDDGGPPLFTRLYRRDGTPAGPARELARSTPFPGSPEIDFGFNNTFVLAWNDFTGTHDPNGGDLEANYQLFAASPGVETCVFRNGHFRCNVDGGGQPEIDHLFAVRRGLPLLGDVDGDGRDDFCLFRNTRFDCDSGHDYGAAETVIGFGQPGDTPLLGDVDADGRDDPCVFRTGRFLCDTGHDGGAAETVILFGQAGDRGLMGDVNGDGRDEACVFRAATGEFLCDTAGNGGTAETVIAFHLPPGNDTVPMLGDLDSDGRDDPCFFATPGGGVFRCDTGHDGGVAEVVFSISAVGRPLIGNVDGL